MQNRARYKKNGKGDFCSRQNSLSIALVKASISIKIFSIFRVIPKPSAGNQGITCGVTNLFALACQK